MIRPNRRTITFTCIACNKQVTRELDKRKKNIYCSKFCSSRRRVKVREFEKPIVQSLSGRTKLINDKYIVNEEYYDWLNQWTWHTSSTGYAVNRNIINGKKQTVRMHRLIVNSRPGLVVDHINRNKFDNTVNNLRLVTTAENTSNSDRVEFAKHYCWDNSRNKWMVRINNKYIGRFGTEIEAINKVKELTI